MVAKIAAVKVENSWGISRSNLVRCVARLTRSLTATEAERLGRLLPLETLDRDLLIWFCRPEEIEAWTERASRALSLSMRRTGKRGRLRLARASLTPHRAKLKPSAV